MNGVSCRSDVSAKSGTEEFLMPIEAAYHLGITPELLFFYTSGSFKKRPGEHHRLKTHEISGGTRFLRIELDAFDKYLQEPWADVGEHRRDLPQKILAYLHAESGGACVRCGAGVGVETAHIDAWARSYSNHHHNLLRICSACHSEHDLHHSLPTEELRRLKASGVERVRAQLRQRMSAGTGFCTPPPPSMFVGRASELVELRDALRTDRFVLVRGPGGVGKTALTLKALALSDTGRPVLWMDLERYGSVDAVHAALAVAIRDHAANPPSEELIGQLDAVEACLVLDGVEQLHGPELDAIDDWIDNLQATVGAVQIVVTSQVDLRRARFDRQIELHGLDDEASSDMLVHFVRPGIPFDTHSRDTLVTFADGHPLTLRLAAMLVNFFGSGHTACSQIRRRGVELLEEQKRARPDRRTSLRICLSLAYDELDADERRVLFLVANAPGGLFSEQLESEHLGISNGRVAIAGVRRWSLVRTEDAGENIERIFTLSPIASYVESRWRTDAPDEARRLVKELVREFTVMCAVIDERSQGASEIPYMVARFKQELPNILLVFDLAEREPQDIELSLFTSAICTALMRYFFVLRLGDMGQRIMLRGTHIALRDGKLYRASGLLKNLVGLAPRSENSEGPDAVVKMLAEIEGKAVDSATHGNLALVRAILANLEDDAPQAETFARAAIGHYEVARTQYLEHEVADNDKTAASDTEGLDNDLSSAFDLLGYALLTQCRYSESAAAYRTALTWLRGSLIAVNEGQLHHQLGNCEAYLGHFEEAAHYYTVAAQHFHAVGMREYLANALGELGNLLLDFGKSVDLPPLPSHEITHDGLADVAADITRCYARYPFDFGACMASVRKLFGLLVLASLNAQEASLQVFSDEIKSLVIGPATAMLDASLDDGWWDEWGEDAVRHLDALLELAASTATFTNTARIGFSDTDVSKLAQVCLRQGYCGNLKGRSFEWLSLYLRYRWKVAMGTGDELRAAADRAAKESKLIAPPKR